METVYLCFVIFLFALAVFDLMVGVSNDAVNFLNSAIGAKAARFRTVIIIAAIGVFCGAALSNGMMDIARHGIFRPEQFLFEDLMWIFLGVMITDIVLLDVFNSLGMPTSTTVSMVFELLGGTFMLSIVKLMGDDSGTLALEDLINGEKALSVIIGIFVSVAIAFTFGALVQWLTRLLFGPSPSLRDTSPLMGRKGMCMLLKFTLFGAVSMTSIVWFLLIKGLKGSTFMTKDVLAWIDANTWLVLAAVFLITYLISVCIYLFPSIKGGARGGSALFKIIVLMGTFALATAFAGNDLVNFIGVPLAGFSSFTEWQAAGCPDGSLLMDSLNDPATTPTYFLVIAGVIMVWSLATSKKAQNVVKTSVDLSRQDEGDEMFGSSHMARWMVRNSSSLAESIVCHTPLSLRRWIDSRFDRSEVTLPEGAAFDMVRAAVNLVLAGLLVALGTSLKLPLSTTYVTFMVAMGTSLADRAWSRESAVYRITGVLSVIGGWLITAGAAFATCALVVAAMHYGGVIVAIVLVVVAVGLLIRSNIQFRRKQREEKEADTWQQLIRVKGRDEAWSILSKFVVENQIQCVDFAKTTYCHLTEGFAHENLRLLRRASAEIRKAKPLHKMNRRREMIGLRKIDPSLAIEKNTWFHLGENSCMQMHYCLARMCDPTLEHVDNNFEPISPLCIEEFRPMRNELVFLIEKTRTLLEQGRFRDADALRAECDRVKEEFSLTRKRLIDRMQDESESLGANYVYLNILQESQELISTLRHLLRAAKNFQTEVKI